MSKKIKQRWIVSVANQNGTVEFFDGDATTKNMNKAYVFNNFYVANTVCCWWNQQAGKIEHYEAILVNIEKSKKITKVVS